MHPKYGHKGEGWDGGGLLLFAPLPNPLPRRGEGILYSGRLVLISKNHKATKQKFQTGTKAIFSHQH